MNYHKIYYQIIYDPRNHLYEGYVEKHHIVPRSLNGSNSSDNIVRLTARQHFVVHWLLTKMYEGEARKKMITAFHFMVHRQGGMKLNSFSYQLLKKERSKIASEALMGKTIAKGHKHSPEAKKAKSERQKGVKHTKPHSRNPLTEEHKIKLRKPKRKTSKWSIEDRQKHSLRMTGRIVTKETRDKIAASNRRRSILKKQDRNNNTEKM